MIPSPWRLLRLALLGAAPVMAACTTGADPFASLTVPLASNSALPTTSPGASTSATPVATTSPAPTASPAATASASPTASPTPTPAPAVWRLTDLAFTRTIRQLWLPQVANEVPPVAVPTQYRFAVEAQLASGSAHATGSQVVWTSSQPQLLTIDEQGLAVAVVHPTFLGNVPVTLTAATSNADTATLSARFTVWVGNSGLLDINIR